MDPAFAFPGVQAEIFVPLQIDPAVAPRDGRNYSTVARLRPGVSLPLAQQDMEAIAAQTARERPTYNTYWSATVVPLTEQAVGDIRRPLVILLGTVICVLLVACANIVNLSLMRATARAREMTVRLALGAGRGRLLHQLMTESLVLAAMGGGLGLLLAMGGEPAIVSMFPVTFPLPRSGEIGSTGACCRSPPWRPSVRPPHYSAAPGVNAISPTRFAFTSSRPPSFERTRANRERRQNWTPVATSAASR